LLDLNLGDAGIAEDYCELRFFTGYER